MLTEPWTPEKWSIDLKSLLMSKSVLHWQVIFFPSGDWRPRVKVPMSRLFDVFLALGTDECGLFYGFVCLLHSSTALWTLRKNDGKHSNTRRSFCFKIIWVLYKYSILLFTTSGKQTMPNKNLESCFSTRKLKTCLLLFPGWDAPSK